MKNRKTAKSKTDSNHFSLFTIQCPVHLQNCIPRISITNISLNLLWEFRDLLEKQIQFMSTWNGDVLRAFRLRFIAARERMSLPSAAPFFSFINNGSIPQFLPPSFYFYSLVIRIFFHFYSASLHWPNHLEMSFWPLLFSIWNVSVCHSFTVYANSISSKCLLSCRERRGKDSFATQTSDTNGNLWFKTMTSFLAENDVLFSTFVICFLFTLIFSHLWKEMISFHLFCFLFFKRMKTTQGQLWKNYQLKLSLKSIICKN